MNALIKKHLNGLSNEDLIDAQDILEQMHIAMLGGDMERHTIKSREAITNFLDELVQRISDLRNNGKL